MEADRAVDTATWQPLYNDGNEDMNGSKYGVFDCIVVSKSGEIEKWVRQIRQGPEIMEVNHLEEYMARLDGNDTMRINGNNNKKYWVVIK